MNQLAWHEIFLYSNEFGVAVFIRTRAAVPIISKYIYKVNMVARIFIFTVEVVNPPLVPFKIASNSEEEEKIIKSEKIK